VNEDLNICNDNALWASTHSKRSSVEWQTMLAYPNRNAFYWRVSAGCIVITFFR
jgi:hypothetical protein